MEKRKNFWCRNGWHSWKDIMPMCKKGGLLTYDTVNDWRECKKCKKVQMRRDVYSNWKTK